jgi:transcription initiation factor IIE alpha subunit
MPTIVETFHGSQECPRCGTLNVLDRHDIARAAEQIEERLARLEMLCEFIPVPQVPHT